MASSTPAPLQTISNVSPIRRRVLPARKVPSRYMELKKRKNEETENEEAPRKRTKVSSKVGGKEKVHSVVVGMHARRSKQAEAQLESKSYKIQLEGDEDVNLTVHADHLVLLKDSATSTRVVVGKSIPYIMSYLAGVDTPALSITQRSLMLPSQLFPAEIPRVISDWDTRFRTDGVHHIIPASSKVLGSTLHKLQRKQVDRHPNPFGRVLPGKIQRKDGR